MTRSALAAIAVLTIPLTAAAADPPKRLNLVFILTDDQARWAAGCYGNPDVKTLAADIEKTQQAEITTMQKLLG